MESSTVKANGKDYFSNNFMAIFSIRHVFFLNEIMKTK
jgi:hypothetical protein